MTQTVLIGLGGTGSRVVNNVAKTLRKNNVAINDGVVTCAVMDTNQADNVLVGKSGTMIPVIPTCDDKTIDEYLNLYANKRAGGWCPYSRAFGAESMIDGASEIRVKSRLAFMDTMESGRIFELQNAIEKVFHNKPGTPEKIRVMLVTSLSGGTGSGMFLQVALWLRKFFEERNCMATIRGIFLLPDIFVRSVPNIRENGRKKLYHYANAYAAIRELNAINKVIKGNYVPDQPIIIDGLFDSRKPNKKPVFDNAFFIDDVDASGAAFNSIGAYEEMVAQIVYMQLYAPMHSELSSVEDNLFRAFESNPEPVFGSCGTAKAEYPVEDVVEYCALRASRDSIAEGWHRIDAEIDAMIEEEKNAEKDGIVLNKRVSRRDEFIRLFDEKANKSGAEIGLSDRLFVTIKNDAFNEKREAVADGEEAPVVLTCKIEAFMNLVEEEILKTVTADGGCDKVTKACSDLPDAELPENFPDDIVEILKGIREKEEKVVEKVVRTFDENAKDFADAIVRSLVPLDMSTINKNNEKSLYGLFVKKDLNGGDYYVHPVAAKYLLYKLSKAIEIRQNTLAPDSRRAKALKGDDTVSFDNLKTRKIETREEYWSQLGLFTSKSEIQHFIRRYKEYNIKNKTLCMDYEKESLSQKVFKELSERIKRLIEEMEKLFKDFPKLSEKITEEISDNVKRNEDNLTKTLFVLAKQKHKEAKYSSLGIELNGRNDDLNKDVITSVYGKFCAQYRPNIEENREYVDKSIITTFHNKLVNTFEKLIAKECKDDVDLDIISAIKQESDYEFALTNDGEADRDPFADENAMQRTATRHDRAIIGYRDRLNSMSAPFLRARPDEALAVVSNVEGVSYDENNAIWMTTEDGRVLHMPFQTKLTFWGFHPSTVENYPNITAALGANMATAADTGYRKNELYCYSSVYGIKAEAIDKFNEQNGGDYYTHYSAVINNMLTRGFEIDTPHIDKTWHEFLPYVSEAKQSQSNQTFYKAFWRAIAYGRISLDLHDRYQLSEQTTDSYGNVNYEPVLLMENDRPIGVTDITRLLKALRNHATFKTVVAGQLEEYFKKDVEGMSTYIGTEIIQGLLVEGDLNPVTMIVRYESAQGYSAKIKGDLVGGLAEIMKDVASEYDMNRGDAQIEDAKIRLCHRVYEKCKMTRKNVLFEAWVKDFKRLKLAVDSADDANGSATEVVDII